jgi:hypothetical protein
MWPLRQFEAWFPDRASRVCLVLSVLLALFLWAWTASEAKAIDAFEVPVDFTGVPQGMAVVGTDAHRTAVVQVRGPKEILKRMGPADVDIRVDLSLCGLGPQVVEVPRQGIRLPSSIQLVAVYPSVLHISLEKLVTAPLPIRPDFVGKPAEGLVVLGWSIEPPEAQVKGPKKHLRKLTHLGTRPVSLDGRREDFAEAVAPVAQDTEVSVEPGAGWILKVRLGEQTGRRSVRGIPVTVVNARGLASTKPGAVEVNVEGPASLVATLGPSDFRCEVDAQGLAPGEAPYEIKPAVRALKKDPSGRLAVTAVDPHFVSVRIAHR